MTNSKSRKFSVVERNDSHLPLKDKEMVPYSDHMKATFGDTKVPTVIYKGRRIEGSELGKRSYLTREV